MFVLSVVVFSLCQTSASGYRHEFRNARVALSSLGTASDGTNASKIDSVAAVVNDIEGNISKPVQSSSSSVEEIMASLKPAFDQVMNSGYVTITDDGTVQLLKLQANTIKFKTNFPAENDATADIKTVIEPSDQAIVGTTVQDLKTLLLIVGCKSISLEGKSTAKGEAGEKLGKRRNDWLLNKLHPLQPQYIDNKAFADQKTKSVTIQVRSLLSIKVLKDAPNQGGKVLTENEIFQRMQELEGKVAGVEQILKKGNVGFTRTGTSGTEAVFKLHKLDDIIPFTQCPDCLGGYKVTYNSATGYLRDMVQDDGKKFRKIEANQKNNVIATIQDIAKLIDLVGVAEISLIGHSRQKRAYHEDKKNAKQTDEEEARSYAVATMLASMRALNVAKFLIAAGAPIGHIKGRSPNGGQAYTVVDQINRCGTFVNGITEKIFLDKLQFSESSVKLNCEMVKQAYRATISPQLDLQRDFRVDVNIKPFLNVGLFT